MGHFEPKLIVGNRDCDGRVLWEEGVLGPNSLGFEKIIVFSCFYKHMFNVTSETVVANYGFIFIFKS